MTRDITDNMKTSDGYDFRTLAKDLPGEYPVAIFVPATNGIYRLTADLVCHENEGMSLSEPRRENTRYFNVYRAADGGFTVGSKAFTSNEARTMTDDSSRAIYGIKLTINETLGSAQGTLLEAQ